MFNSQLDSHSFAAELQGDMPSQLPYSPDAVTGASPNPPRTYRGIEVTYDSNRSRYQNPPADRPGRGVPRVPPWQFNVAHVDANSQNDTSRSSLANSMARANSTVRILGSSLLRNIGLMRREGLDFD
jgi:hypothetical protein